MNIAEITKDLFNKIEEKNAKYCIYNGYEKLPQTIDSDLDIAIEEKGLQKLDTKFFNLAKDHHLLLLHKIWHDDRKYAYVLTPSKLTDSERLQIDFLNEFSSKDFKKGYLSRFALMDENELLNNREKLQYFYIPAPHKEFIMKFLRRVLKEDLNKEKFERLIDLYNKERDKCRQKIKNYFPDQLDLIVNTLEKEDFEKLHIYMKLFKKELNKFKKNLFSLRNLFRLLERVLFRIKYPVGMSVVFLGPDGCGKSTIVRTVMDVLSGSFHGQELFYWRPEFLRQPGVALRLREEVKTGINPNPHGHPTEHPIRSFLRFSYYILDFTFGYLLKTWPLVVKKHLCIFDRYYYDALVDSFRYNFSLPKWLLKIPMSIIPKPDLTIILDVPVEELVRRKQELSVSELRRQRTEFLKLAEKIPNAYFVNNSRPMEEVIREITGIILLNKSYQTYFSLKLKQSEDELYFENLKNLFNIKNDENRRQRLIAFPDANSPRVFYAANNVKCFKTSLKLYTPSRPFIKFIYTNAPAMFLYPLLKRVSKSAYFLENSSLSEKIRSIFPSCEAISICTGAPGPHRKPLIQIMEGQGKVTGYLKLGINDETKALLERETESINFAKSLNFKTALVPEIVEKDELDENISYLALNAVNTPFRKSYKFTDTHIAFITEMFEKTGKEEIFGETKLYKRIAKRVNFLEDKIPYYWILRYRRILEFYKDRKIPIYFSHGDFTPWNVFITRGKGLLLFDWEYSRENVAFGDLFHFVIQSKTFAQKRQVKPPKLLWHFKKEITLLKRKINAFSLDNWTDMLLIYLFEISSFYFVRNFRTGFIEKDLRLEVTWSNLIDYLLNNITK